MLAKALSLTVSSWVASYLLHLKSLDTLQRFDFGPLKVYSECSIKNFVGRYLSVFPYYWEGIYT